MINYTKYYDSLAIFLNKLFYQGVFSHNLNIPKTSVFHVLKKKEETYLVINKRRSGRKSITSASEDKFITILIVLDQVDVYMYEENPKTDYLSSVWYPQLSGLL